jgi:hypothetical protein
MTGSRVCFITVTEASGGVAQLQVTHITIIRVADPSMGDSPAANTHIGMGSKVIMAKEPVDELMRLLKQAGCKFFAARAG